MGEVEVVGEGRGEERPSMHMLRFSHYVLLGSELRLRVRVRKLKRVKVTREMG